MPFQGLIEAIPNWSSVVWVAILSLATLGAVAYVRAPDRHVRAVVLVSGAFASTMSVLVWRSGDVVRPLLPLAAIGACLLTRKVRSPADDPSAATPVAPFSPESEPVGP